MEFLPWFAWSAYRYDNTLGKKKTIVKKASIDIYKYVLDFAIGVLLSNTLWMIAISNIQQF